MTRENLVREILPVVEREFKKPAADHKGEQYRRKIGKLSSVLRDSQKRVSLQLCMLTSLCKVKPKSE